MQIALKGMARRSFLIALGVALLMLFTFRLRAFWRPFIISPRKGDRLPSRPNPFREGDKVSAAIVHGRDIEKNVREALDLIGGIERLEVLGKTVLLKPNIVSGVLSPPRPIQRWWRLL